MRLCLQLAAIAPGAIAGLPLPSAILLLQEGPGVEVPATPPTLAASPLPEAQAQLPAAQGADPPSGAAAEGQQPREGNRAAGDVLASVPMVPLL